MAKIPLKENLAQICKCFTSREEIIITLVICIIIGSSITNMSS